MSGHQWFIFSAFWGSSNGLLLQNSTHKLPLQWWQVSRHITYSTRHSACLFAGLVFPELSYALLSAFQLLPASLNLLVVVVKRNHLVYRLHWLSQTTTTNLCRLVVCRSVTRAKRLLQGYRFASAAALFQCCLYFYPFSSHCRLHLIWSEPEATSAVVWLPQNDLPRKVCLYEKWWYFIGQTTVSSLPLLFVQRLCSTNLKQRTQSIDHARGQQLEEAEGEKDCRHSLLTNFYLHVCLIGHWYGPHFMAVWGQ